MKATSLLFAPARAVTVDYADNVTCISINKTPSHSFPQILRSFIIPLMRTPDALVKHAHGFVRAAYLHLHEVRLPEAAGGTDGHGPIDVLPRVRPPKYVVDLLPIRRVRPLYLGRRDGLGVGARRAGEDRGR
jgi:hypothetical protein